MLKIKAFCSEAMRSKHEQRSTENIEYVSLNLTNQFQYTASSVFC